MPILRARGLFRTEYTGRTLRDHLGLERPASQYAPHAARGEDRMSFRALPTPGPHRRPGQPADPRRDDVRRVGQPRPRRVDRDHPPRARRRDQRHRHRRRLRPRRVRGDRRQGAAGPQGQPRRRLPRHQVPRQHARRGPQPGGQLAPLDRPRGRGLAAPAPDRPHRPLPGAPPAPRGRHRRDPRRAHRPRAAGQDPLHRHVDVPALAGRRGAVGRREAPARAPGLRAAAVLDPRPRGGARHPADRAEVRHRRAAVEPARGRLALGPLPPRRGARGHLEPAATASPRGTTRPPRRTRSSSRRSTSCRSSPTRPACR